jgi:hypothetical protein
VSLIPQLLEINIQSESDLDSIAPAIPSIFKTHLHLNIDESLAENIPLEFNGNAQELKWKVIELVKVPLEELFYAYAPQHQKLYLLNKKIWQQKFNDLDFKAFQIEKITLAGLPLCGLEINEPILHYEQINKGLLFLSLLAAGCIVLMLGLSFFFKTPPYQALAALRETSQNLKTQLNQVIETEKELSHEKEKTALQKKWVKIFKNFPQQIPALVKLSEISLDETSRVLHLKGESKNQGLLQNWAKQMPDFEMTQIQLQPSPNTGYQFTASIQARDNL